MYAHIYTYTVISSPGLVCRRPSGRIRHQKRHLFGDIEILKQNFMKNGGGGAPRSLTASQIHMENQITKSYIFKEREYELPWIFLSSPHMGLMAQGD